MRQTKIQLTEEDRATLKSFRSKGQHMAREINRAHILSALDQSVPEKQIMSVLGIGRNRYLAHSLCLPGKGLNYALHDVERPGQPIIYGTDQQAEVVALACSTPPKGAQALDNRLVDRSIETASET